MAKIRIHFNAFSQFPVLVIPIDNNKPVYDSIRCIYIPLRNTMYFMSERFGYGTETINKYFHNFVSKRITGNYMTTQIRRPYIREYIMAGILFKSYGHKLNKKTEIHDET